jgi:hypothetical protein
VSYTEVNKLNPLVNAAKKFEQAIHMKDRETKSAGWLVKLAKEADLELDDDMQ